MIFRIDKSKLSSTMATALRIVGFSGRYKKYYIIGLFLSAFDSVFSVGIVLGLQKIIDAMSEGRTRDLYLMLIYTMAAIIVCISFMMLGGALRMFASVQTIKNMSHILLDHINRLPFEYIQESHTGDLAERVNADVSKAAEVMSSSFVQLFSSLLTFAGAFAYLASVNLWLSLLALATGPVTFAAGRFFDYRIRKASEELNNKSGEQRGLMQEFLQSMPVVRVMGLDSVLIERFRKLKSAQLGVTKRKALLNLAMWRSVFLINGITTISLAYLVAMAAVNGTMSIGYVLSFIFLLGRLQWPFVNISSTWGAINNSLGAADRVFKILDNKTELEPDADGADDADDTCKNSENSMSDYAIEINHVSFARKGTEILKDVSLKLKKGETVAIVGPSGSGKSTLARLCCGLLMPDKGEVRVFGHNVCENLAYARGMLAYVPQVPYLFSGTIEENILYGVPQVVDGVVQEEGAFENENVIKASEMANSHSFINLLKEGYRTHLKELGSNLSGGQKQRIAIARALSGNAPLLVFDEATSSLDNESEQMIKVTMDKLSGSRTMLVIAHRLSSIRNADRVVVLANGSIVEEGTHDELISKGGEYNRLYNEAM